MLRVKFWFVIMMYMLLLGFEALPLRHRTRVVFGKCGKGPTSNHYQRAWILDDLLGSCAKEVTCVQELIRAHNSNDSSFVSRFTTPGTAYVLQLDAVDPNRWYMAELQEMFQSRGMDRRMLLLVHVADNRMPPHGSTYEAFYRGWAFVFRNYWWDEPMLQNLFQAQFLKWFPLGYSNHIKNTALQIQNRNMLQPSERNYTIFFIGNKRSGNVKREKHIEELKRTTRLNFTGGVNKGNFGAGSHDVYARGLDNSKFCLQIPGRFAECYRLYDSLEAGCIPVFVDNYINTNYTAILSESLVRFSDISWKDIDGKISNSVPFLRFPNIREMELNILSLEENPHKLLSIYENCRTWWEQIKQHFRDEFRLHICQT